MKYGDKHAEHNILLYTEELKAKVKGHLEYCRVDKPNQLLTVPIPEFLLDLGYKGQHIIKNHTFKEFWKAVDEVEEILKVNPSITVQELQDLLER